MTEMINNFLALDTFWYWLFAACLLMMMEILIPDMFFMALASAAAEVGIVGFFFPTLTFGWMFTIFSAFAVISIWISQRYLSKEVLVSEEPLLNRRSDDLIGRNFTLHEPIINGEGRVKAMASYWNITGADCPVGSRIKVVDVDGITLKVIVVSTPQ